MKLVHVTTVPMTLRFYSGQVGYMKSRGFEVHAISSPGPMLDEFGRVEEVAVHAVPMHRRVSPIRDAVSLFRLWRLLRRLRPDIVHSHTPKGGLIGMLAAWLARVPVRIYNIHGLPVMTAKGLRRFLLTWSERVSCRLAHQVLCVSRSMREEAIERKLCPAGKVKVLLGGSCNGVDAKGRFNPTGSAAARIEARREWGIPEGALVVGFVGRIVRDKGIVELVEAWKRLRREVDSLHLLIVGPFEPQDPVPSEVAQYLTDDDRVHLTGENLDTPRLFAAMDILVLPTYREGFPVVPLEAAAMGLPVVATRVPGCTDAVVDGRTGTLVPVRDPESLAEAISKYAGDARLRRAHGQAARQRVILDFLPEGIWEATYGEYERLLRQQHAWPADGGGRPSSA